MSEASDTVEVNEGWVRVEASACSSFQSSGSWRHDMTTNRSDEEPSLVHMHYRAVIGMETGSSGGQHNQSPHPHHPLQTSDSAVDSSRFKDSSDCSGSTSEAAGSAASSTGKLDADDVFIAKARADASASFSLQQTLLSDSTIADCCQSAQQQLSASSVNAAAATFLDSSTTEASAVGSAASVELLQHCGELDSWLCHFRLKLVSASSDGWKSQLWLLQMEACSFLSSNAIRYSLLCDCAARLSELCPGRRRLLQSRIADLKSSWEAVAVAAAEGAAVLAVVERVKRDTAAAAAAAAALDGRKRKRAEKRLGIVLNDIDADLQRVQEWLLSMTGRNYLLALPTDLQLSNFSAMSDEEKSKCVLLLQQQEDQFRINLTAISTARRLLDKLDCIRQLSESLELRVQRLLVTTEQRKSRLYELWLQLLELRYSLDSEFLASRRRSRSRQLLVSVDQLNSVFPPGWAGPESGFASERSPSNIASHSAGHSSAGDATDVGLGGLGVGGIRGFGGGGGGGSSRSSQLESACGDSLSSCDILPFSEDEYEKIQDRDNSSSSALSASAVYAANSKTTATSSRRTAASASAAMTDPGASAIQQRPAECGRAAADARRAAMARQVDRWRQDASLRHDLCSRSDSRLRNGFVASRVRSHDTLLRRLSISGSACHSGAADTETALLMLLTREEGGDRLEFLGNGDGNGDGDEAPDDVQGGEASANRQPKFFRSQAEVQVRHSRSAYLATASNYFYGMTAVDNDVLHDDIDGEDEVEPDEAPLHADASPGVADGSHWHGDGVSDVDLSAISQQGGSCPIRLALAQARIAATSSSGSVGSGCSGGGRTRVSRRRDFLSDTRLCWMSLAGESDAEGLDEVDASGCSDGGDVSGEGVYRRRCDATSSDVDSWSFSRSELSSSAGSYPLEMRRRVASRAGISCDSLESGGQQLESSGSAVQDPASTAGQSLLLVERADRHLYRQYRSSGPVESRLAVDFADAAEVEATNADAAAATATMSGEEDQSGLDESSRSTSQANEHLDVDQLWDYSCQPHLYSDADEADDDGCNALEVEAVLDDSQLLWEIEQPDAGAGGLLLPPPPPPPPLPNHGAHQHLHQQDAELFGELEVSDEQSLWQALRDSAATAVAPSASSDQQLSEDAIDLTSEELLVAKDDVTMAINSAEWRRHVEIKEAAELVHARCLGTDEFDASADGMAAGIEQLDRLVEELQRCLGVATSEVEQLRLAGEDSWRKLLIDNWQLLIGWLRADLDCCQSKRQSLSQSHAAMLELDRVLVRCERLVEQEWLRLRRLESASQADGEAADSAELDEAARNAESAVSLAAHCSAMFNDSEAVRHLTASAYAQTDARVASVVAKSAKLRRRCDRLTLLLVHSATSPKADAVSRRSWCRSVAATAAVASLSLLLLLLIGWLLLLLVSPGARPAAAQVAVTADWGCRQGWTAWLVSRLMPVLRETRPNGAPF